MYVNVYLTLETGSTDNLVSRTFVTSVPFLSTFEKLCTDASNAKVINRCATEIFGEETELEIDYETRIYLGADRNSEIRVAPNYRFRDETEYIRIVIPE